ncbi:hypothetical protein EXU48_05215 [Occultella glacieicola]|uniref:DUF4190 domain-containing protein n=1 Tax=Occultella glacieicola TaxID=2518684 RepID=A0ABY2E7P6_9MICO|nr:hypothetical protein [Occultella glacieicola]TDE97582.1 hypothetical protein EXU48_05215 [Occultella glacieicola]
MSNPYAPPDPSRPKPDPDRHNLRRPDRPPGGLLRPGRPPEEPRPAPSPEQLVEISRSVMFFGLLLLAAVLTSGLPIPWQVAAPLFAGGAIVIGLRTLGKIRRFGVRGMITVFLTGGMVLSALLLFSSVTLLSLWPAQVERQQCLDSALTIAAQDRCEQRFNEAVADRYGTSTGG